MSKEPIRQQTVVAQVMDEIRELIASGAYEPGDRIPTEKELAERFGVGRSSIREAIKIFNYLGVLESKAALGTFVRERSSISTEALTWSLLLGDDELEEIVDLRAAVELWSLIELVNGCRARRPEALESVGEIRAVVDAMEEAAAAGDRPSLVEGDFRFHQAIIRSSRKPLFQSIYDTLRSFLYDEMRKTQDDYADPSQIHAEHRHLLQSIESGEPLEILTDFLAHIGNIKRRAKKKTAKSAWQANEEAD